MKKPLGPAHYFEKRTQMDAADMQDEVNQMAINGMYMAVIDGKVGMRCEHVGIYDYKNNVLITWFRKRALAWFIVCLIYLVKNRLNFSYYYWISY